MAEMQSTAPGRRTLMKESLKVLPMMLKNIIMKIQNGFSN
ncbi:uncharacterized protein METZ01_LOCUS108663 [marine metagenome]|uniref:Uncharacterized protein n=1 Tax=marine metagenome TaxID=408172 RepID=A0A381WTG5_9ZZZZ